MSFFLIRLLQNIDSITLESDAQPPSSRVPESWKDREGRQGIEKFRPKSHFTMFIAVSQADARSHHYYVGI